MATPIPAKAVLEFTPRPRTLPRQKRGRREYFYYKGYRSAVGGVRAKHTLTYVGPVDDVDILRRVEQFGRLKSQYKIRRELASTLRSHGCPVPTSTEGEVLGAFSRAGLFRGKAVLVGTIAFQCYAGMLSVHLPEEGYRTADIDLAQGAQIAVDQDDLPDLGALLNDVDPSFSPVFHPGYAQMPVGYANDQGFRVEFLTTVRRADETVRPLVGLGAAAVQTLKFLEFLLQDTRDGLIVHKAGIGVRVPSPQRYAVHKLLISDLRRAQGVAKAEKDLMQIGLILEAMAMRRCLDDVGFAWLNAAARGLKWFRNLKSGWTRLPDEHRILISDGIRQAVELDGGDDDRLRYDPIPRDASPRPT